MYKKYIKQVWELMKQNRFYSGVYIMGTGLTITLIMVIAMVYHVRTGNIDPESHRDRMLIGPRAHAVNKENGRQYISLSSYQTVRECFYTLTTPQAVTAVVRDVSLKYKMGRSYVNIPGSNDMQFPYIMAVDAGFWKVFNFHFVNGRPFSEEDFISGRRKVIINETWAKSLFGDADIFGRSIMFNDIEYVIEGVVKDVSSTMQRSYADVYILYTSLPVLMEPGNGENIVGPFEPIVLMNKSSAANVAEQEFRKKVEKYNDMLTEWEYKPDSLEKISTEWIKQINYKNSYERNMGQIVLLLFLFMLVPAINLSGLTSSRMQDRKDEMGIRKAFGANRSALIQQVLTENLVLTLAGSIVGLILSAVIVYFSAEMLLSQNAYNNIRTEVALSPGMLFNIPVFLYSLSVCVILNFISSILPVWKVSGQSIIESINEK